MLDDTRRPARSRRLLTGGTLAVIASTALTLQVAAAHGSAGSLDTSFNHVGYTTTSFGPTSTFAFAAGTVVTDDGTVLAVGGVSQGADNEFALAKYTKDGALDTSFGSGGTVTGNYPGSTCDLATAAAYQGDKTVVVGYTSPDNCSTTFHFLVARYNKDGSLDTSFGTDGMTATSFGGGQDIANGVVIKGDKIYVAGVTQPSGGHYEIVLARYTKDGVLDPSFGSGGFVTADYMGTRTDGNSIALQGDRIIVGGEASPGSHFVFAMAGFTQSGTLDPKFGNGGWVITDFGGDSPGFHVDVKGDRIAMLGEAFDGTFYDFAAALYDKDGVPVKDFNGGTVELRVGDNESGAASGGLSEDGTVVAVGSGAANGNVAFAAARWTKSGSPDPSFGSNGKGWVTTSVGTMSAAFAGGFGPDHRIVGVGFSDNDFAVVRYLNT